MASDKGIGAGIIIGVIIAAVLYFGPLVFSLPWSFMGAIKVVVSAAFLLLLGIAGWIGWTMASTPTLEEIEDIEDFEEPEELVETEDFEEELSTVDGVTDSRIQSLKDAGYGSAESLRAATEDELTEVEGIGSTLAGRIKEKYP